MRLNESSIKWAINHLIKFSDTDLFPRPIELQIIYDLKDEAVSELSKLDLSSYSPGVSRKYIVPKGELSYRAATQLSPLDSILFTSIIYQYGSIIESKRIPKSERKVFSYRFWPDKFHRLYDASYSWKIFWHSCLGISKSYSYVIILDIADFYNQIYHHTIENELDNIKFSSACTKYIMSLLKSITANVSRGIPIGPYPAHLIAEVAMKLLDSSLTARGFKYCRYCDDIVIFANSELEARIIHNIVADILDKQQKLILQNNKTKILSVNKFIDHCKEMVEDNPINIEEKEILDAIRKYSNDNPYQTIGLESLPPKIIRMLESSTIEKIFELYFKQDEPDYIRLRWFLRRLAQVGHPCAIEYCVNNIIKLIPALSVVCHYFISVSNGKNIKWKPLGLQLVDLLDNDLIKSNEYFQLSICSLFNNIIKLDNVGKLLNRYSNSTSTIKREIILTAYRNKEAGWLSGLKGEYQTMDPWCKTAFIIACKVLPKKERCFFMEKTVEKFDSCNTYIKLLSSWVKK